MQRAGMPVSGMIRLGMSSPRIRACPFWAKVLCRTVVGGSRWGSRPPGRPVHVLRPGARRRAGTRPSGLVPAARARRTGRGCTPGQGDGRGRFQESLDPAYLS